MGVDLDRLRPDARVRFPGSADVVTLVRVTGGPFWEFFFDNAQPRLYRVQGPARTLDGAWQPSLDVRYRVDPEPVIEAAKEAPE